MINNTIYILAQADPLKFLLSKPQLAGRTTKWIMQLQEFDLVYVHQQSVKGQAVADMLSAAPVLGQQSSKGSFQDEFVAFIDLQYETPWILYFDGSKCLKGTRAGIVLISSQKDIIPMANKSVLIALTIWQSMKHLLLG